MADWEGRGVGVKVNYSSPAALIGVVKAIHTNLSVINGFMVPGSRTALVG